MNDRSYGERTTSGFTKMVKLMELQMRMDKAHEAVYGPRLFRNDGNGNRTAVPWHELAKINLNNAFKYRQPANENTYRFPKQTDESLIQLLRIRNNDDLERFIKGFAAAVKQSPGNMFMGVGGGGGEPKTGKSNNTSNEKVTSEAKIKNKTNNDTILTPNGDVITSKGIFIPHQFLQAIQSIESSEKKGGFNTYAAPFLNKMKYHSLKYHLPFASPFDKDYSVGIYGIKPTTVMKMTFEGYFPNLKGKTYPEVNDYIENNSDKAAGELLGAYVDKWKDYIDLTKPDNFAVLATLFNQSEQQPPHKNPIIPKDDYGMIARDWYLYGILNEDPLGNTLPGLPPSPKDFTRFNPGTKKEISNKYFEKLPIKWPKNTFYKYISWLIDN